MAEHRLGGGAAQHGGPAGDPPHRVDDLGVVGFLRHEPVGARPRRFDEGGAVGQARAHQDPGVGREPADLRADLEPIPVGQSDVQHHDVRLQLASQGERLVRGARVSDDVRTLLGVEQGAEPVANELVIVDDQDLDTQLRTPWRASVALDDTVAPGCLGGSQRASGAAAALDGSSEYAVRHLRGRVEQGYQFIVKLHEGHRAASHVERCAVLADVALADIDTATGE